VPVNAELGLLRANTQNWLENHALIIYGTGGASGREDFVLSESDDQGWITTVGGLNQPVPLYVMYPQGAYNAKTNGQVSRPFRVHYISMRQFNAVTQQWENAATTHYTLPTWGRTVMVTSKINGCTFGIGSNGGARLVSHLRPPGETFNDRMELERGISGGFGLGGVVNARLHSSGTQNGTVVGIRNGAAWTFYAQRFRPSPSMIGGFIDGVQVYN